MKFWKFFFHESKNINVLHILTQPKLMAFNDDIEFQTKFW